MTPRSRFPDRPLRLGAVGDAEGRLDADRFYRHQENVQAFFDAAGRLETRFAA